jgi:hypothetical protein
MSDLKAMLCVALIELFVLACFALYAATRIGLLVWM